MAYGPNASLCTQMVLPEKKVISIVGDSSFMMSPYVLDTAKMHGLPISFIIINDSALGNVRDVLSRKGRAISTWIENDFAKIANGFGVNGLKVKEYKDLKPALEHTFNSRELMVLDIEVNPKASHMRIRRS